MTKLYIPSPQPTLVLRPRLIERLRSALQRKLTLISAAAGFGKTSLLSEWLVSCERPVAWLSLDEGDSDPSRFLAYLVAALQTIAATIGEGVLTALQSPQAPELILTSLLNDITTIPENFILVLDDYQLIENNMIDNFLSFLLENMPPQMHLIIATREDPQLPLARLRARNQLHEIRIADLRFTISETAEFLNQVMRLKLSSEDISALETRTEGWIAGLQLAAISMQGQQDNSNFIKSFTGSHRFVLDYLLEEVLHRQPEAIQNFLLQSSILERLSGSLCDALMLSSAPTSQEILDYIERANLFIVPLDNERRWYRYHHLFGDLLRQRLQQSKSADTISELHIRASSWYEESGLELEAFHHAALANDIERAERLIEGKGMPLHFRGAVIPVLNWLNSLSPELLNAHPSLWTSYASVLLVTGQTSRVDFVLQSAEDALASFEPDAKTHDLIGRIAAIRATLAVSRNQLDAIISQSERALEYLHPNNLSFRTSTHWKLGFAYQFQGDRAAAKRAYSEVISTGQASGNIIFTVMATIGLGNLAEGENQLHHAAELYHKSLELFGKHPMPIACEAHLGLARIAYQWNDLATAEKHLEQGAQLAQQMQNTDRFLASEIFLIRLKLAQGDLAGALSVLSKSAQLIQQQNFVRQMPELIAVQVLCLLHQGKIKEAAQIAQDSPLSQARLALAMGDGAAALAILEPMRQSMEAKAWQDEALKIMLLQALALKLVGEQEKAVQTLAQALSMAEANGFIRIFLNEGILMAQLLSEVAAEGLMLSYVAKLLALFDTEKQNQTLVEALSQRELEILRLIAQGRSNQEISERLFLALSSVKGHNQNIFGKLQVQRRTEAVARARELGLL